MVDCALARSCFCLAPCDSTARNQFHGRTAVVLDGRGFYSAAVSGTTPGLLFNDHVERIRALGSGRMGANTAGVTCRRCNRCRTRGRDGLGRGILRRRRSTRFKREVGVMDARWTAWKALHDMPVSTWLAFRPLIAVFGVSLICLSLVALYFISKKRERLAAIALAASMVPGGLSMMEAVAQTSPYFSLADAARSLNPRLDPRGAAIFEGPLADGSSLIFYLNRRIFLVNQKPEKETPMSDPSIDMFLNEAAVLEKWGQPDAVYLIIEESRSDYWKQILTSHFHIYHQITKCGTYLVLSNQL